MPMSFPKAWISKACISIVALVVVAACGDDNAGEDAESAACGAAGEACCEDDACDAQGCCVNDVCMAAGTSCGGGFGMCTAGACDGCGSLTEPCCGGVCEGELLCQEGPGAGPAGSQCVTCGTDTLPCCEDRVCSAGVCVGLEDSTCHVNCGAATQVCCAEDSCQPGLECMTGMCQGTPCGTLDLACCAEGDECLVSNAVCSANVCAECGSQGQLCCPGMGMGDACNPGLDCIEELCAPEVPCGALGEMCCDGSGNGGCSGPGLVCVEDSCRLCGRAGEPCCDGMGNGGCNAPLTCQETDVCGNAP